MAHRNGEQKVNPDPPATPIATPQAPPRRRALFVPFTGCRSLLSRVMQRGVDTIEARTTALGWPTAMESRK